MLRAISRRELLQAGACTALGLSLLALFTVYFMLWLLPRFRAMRRRSIELLCETEWARGQNYTPSQVRIMTFPWSK